MIEPAKPWDARLAAIVVRPLAKTPLTPNAITGLGLAAGVAAAVSFADGLDGWGGALFVLALFLDHADGEFARLTGRTSRFGHVFDRVASGVNLSAVFIGMGLGLAANGPGFPWLAVGIVAGLAVSGIFALRGVAERRFGGDFVRERAFGGFEPEDVMYLIAPLAWLDWHHGFLVLAALGAPAYLAWTWIRIRRPAPKGRG